MIMVCDAIMGTGKSSSAINYMNGRKNEKFIYITPYLEEAKRIRHGCPDLGFVEPSNKLKEYGFSKSMHTAALIDAGKNIATTHQAFKYYTQEMLDNIRAKGYTLIIEENVDVLETCDFHPGDLKMAVDAGYISEHNGHYALSNDSYSGKALSELFRLIKSRELVRIPDGGSSSVFFWALPPDLLTSFKDVIILTYLFNGQSLRYFLDIYNLPYVKIGIGRDSSGNYNFCDYPGYTPEYVSSLKNKIHIVDNDKLNAVGDEVNALSMNWFERHPDGITRLKNNVYNCFTNVWGDSRSGDRMWGTYSFAESKLKGKGYSSGFVIFNVKATNQYINKRYLIYLSNIYMNVNEKKFYQMYGIDVDEKTYALSTMIQWIWRSAIREGDEIYLYIPSSRMRALLVDWIDTVVNEGDNNK